MRTILAILVMLLCTNVAVYSQTDDDSANRGIELYAQKNYAAAIPFFQKAAKTGNLKALDYLGFMYEFGQGVPVNYTIAMNLYLKGIDKNYVPILHNMARLYKEGKGVAKNFDKAVMYYEKAAEQKDLDTYRMLGDIYIDIDPQKAFYWYKKWQEEASEETMKGDVYIIHYLSTALREGIGIEKDLRSALLYASIATKTESKEVSLKLYDSLLEELTPSLTLKEAYGYGMKYYKDGQLLKALPLFMRASELGDINAKRRLGDIYYFGKGTTDESKATFWYKKALQEGDVQALCSLGNIYKKSAPAQSKDYFLRAARQDDLYGQEQVGSMLAFEKKYDQAIPWLEKAGARGSNFACYSLGCLYMDLNKYKLARIWFEKAANRGYEAAQSYLKFMNKSNYY